LKCSKENLEITATSKELLSPRRKKFIQISSSVLDLQCNYPYLKRGGLQNERKRKEDSFQGSR
jgi:hypothetical protein